MQHETERGFFGPGTEPQRAHRSTGRRRGPGRFGAHGTAVRAAERGCFVGADPACGRILAAVAGVPAGMDDRAAALAAGGACPYCPAGTRRLPGGIPLHGAARRAAAAALGRGTACARQLERGCTGAVVDGLSGPRFVPAGSAGADALGKAGGGGCRAPGPQCAGPCLCGILFRPAAVCRKNAEALAGAALACLCGAGRRMARDGSCLRGG